MTAPPQAVPTIPPAAPPLPSAAAPVPPVPVSRPKPVKLPVKIQKKIVPPKVVPAKPSVVPTVVPPPVPVQPVFVPPPLPPEPKEWSGNDTSVTHAGQIVIHNDRQWVHFWSEHHPHEAAPEIDFAKDMVIGVFAGPRPAEQFTIRMTDVRTMPDSLVVDYRERLPPPGTFAVNVTVYPYAIKVIPRSTLPVKFNLLQPENVNR